MTNDFIGYEHYLYEMFRVYSQAFGKNRDPTIWSVLKKRCEEEWEKDEPMNPKDILFDETGR